MYIRHKITENITVLNVRSIFTEPGAITFVMDLVMVIILRIVTVFVKKMFVKF